MEPSGVLLLLKVFLVVSIADIAQAECALGWIHYGDSCYLFSSDTYDWFTAQSSCHAHNAKLAEPANKAQTDYLIHMAYIIGKGAWYYWLGGRDDVVEGIWQWSSSDTIITYKPWWAGEPNNLNGIEDCLEIRCDSVNCMFNDNVCTEKNYFICERRYIDSFLPLSPIILLTSLTIAIARRVSYTKQELLAFRERIGSQPIYWYPGPGAEVVGK